MEPVRRISLMSLVTSTRPPTLEVPAERFWCLARSAIQLQTRQQGFVGACKGLCALRGGLTLSNEEALGGNNGCRHGGCSCLGSLRNERSWTESGANAHCVIRPWGGSLALPCLLLRNQNCRFLPLLSLFSFSLDVYREGLEGQDTQSCQTASHRGRMQICNLELQYQK